MSIDQPRRGLATGGVEGGDGGNPVSTARESLSYRPVDLATCCLEHCEPLHLASASASRGVAHPYELLFCNKTLACGSIHLLHFKCPSRQHDNQGSTDTVLKTWAYLGTNHLHPAGERRFDGGLETRSSCWSRHVHWIRSLWRSEGHCMRWVGRRCQGHHGHQMYRLLSWPLSMSVNAAHAFQACPPNMTPPSTKDIDRAASSLSAAISILRSAGALIFGHSAVPLPVPYLA
jgi:hypothetical protein